MTKENAKNMGLLNIDKWWGKGNEYIIFSLQKFVTQFIADDCLDLRATDAPYVITTKDKTFGASCFSNPYYIRAVADIFGTDLIILPSSIHEIIVLPYNEENEAHKKDYIDMVRSINANIVYVNPDEKLGDDPLLYKRETEEFVVW